MKIILPSQPRLDADAVRAWQEWQRTGYVPDDYVQAQLKRSWTSGTPIADLVRASLGSYVA